MRNSMNAKVILFSDYLKQETMTSSTSENRNIIRRILLNNKFRLVDPHDDGNNYYQFLDDEGYLTFNNPDMAINSANLSMGCIRGTRSGNSIRYNNLLLCVTEEKKEEIVSDLIKIESQFKELETEKKELMEKLEYLLIVNSEILIQKDYDNYKKESVTNKLLERI